MNQKITLNDCLSISNGDGYGKSYIWRI